MAINVYPLSHTRCPKCEGLIPEVIYAEKGIRQGWWCHRCRHLERAIGRERVVKRPSQPVLTD